MSGLPQLAKGESIVIELVPTDQREYVRNRNRVAAITESRLVYLRKKVLGAYYEIEYIDLDKVEELVHSRTFAFGAMLGGLILLILSLALAAAVVMGYVTGFIVVVFPIICGSLGVALVFGVRRRKIVFGCRDRDLVWVSAPLGFRKTAETAERVRALFEARGVRSSGFEGA